MVALDEYGLSEQATEIVCRDGDVDENIYRMAYIGAEISRLLVITHEGEPVYFAKTTDNVVVELPSEGEDPMREKLYNCRIDSGARLAISVYADMLDISLMRALSHCIILADAAKIVTFGRANFNPALHVRTINVPERLPDGADFDDVVRLMLGS